MGKLGVLLILSVLSAAEVCLADETTIAHTSIAAGSTQWVANHGDRSPTDAMVDIGTMKQIGDALEVIIRWPYLPASYGPQPADKERIVCQADHAVSFSVEGGFFSPDGQYHIKQAYDPASERAKVEQREAQMAKIGNGFSSYGSDPRSLACWAAARKCAGQSFTWPPPPNRTPLEYTAQARQLSEDYNKQFVPTCKLNGG